MKKFDNQIFQDRRKSFLSKLDGKAAIIPGAKLVHIMLIANIPLGKKVISGI